MLIDFKRGYAHILRHTYLVVGHKFTLVYDMF